MRCNAEGRLWRVLVVPNSSPPVRDALDGNVAHQAQGHFELAAQGDQSLGHFVAIRESRRAIRTSRHGASYALHECHRKGRADETTTLGNRLLLLSQLGALGYLVMP
jgi:hypothetical protein